MARTCFPEHVDLVDPRQLRLGAHSHISVKLYHEPSILNTHHLQSTDISGTYQGAYIGSDHGIVMTQMKVNKESKGRAKFNIEKLNRITTNAEFLADI